MRSSTTRRCGSLGGVFGVVAVAMKPARRNNASGRAAAVLLAAAAALGLRGAEGPAAGSVEDKPYPQMVSRQFPSNPELAGAEFERVVADKEGRVFALTDRGLARLIGGRLALDRSLEAWRIRPVYDLCVARGGLFCLLDREFFSPAFAGRFLASWPEGDYRRFAVAEDMTALLTGPTNAVWFHDPKFDPVTPPLPGGVSRIWAAGREFYALTPTAVYRVRAGRSELFYRGGELTSLAVATNMVWVGSLRGVTALSRTNGAPLGRGAARAPRSAVTALASGPGGLWAGTRKGVWRLEASGRIRYFASRRWLPDDWVADVAADGEGAWVLTRLGLAWLGPAPMTLTDKAAAFDQRIRRRHLRFGLCAALQLPAPGEETGARLTADEWDGVRTCLYLAAQVFRFAVTGSEEARANAWEAFSALERLEWLTPLSGLPASSYARTGAVPIYRGGWQAGRDPRWMWRQPGGDRDLAALTFACAAQFEFGAKTLVERRRVAVFFDRIADLLVRSGYKWPSPAGQAVALARWDPAYVNRLPLGSLKRRLLSAEALAALQLAYHMTSRPVYRDRAVNLLQREGYLANLTNSMSLYYRRIAAGSAPPPAAAAWDHGDDLSAFLVYWPLWRFALSPPLKRLYAAAMAEHWQLERGERDPLWNFLFGMIGAPACDVAAAAETLRRWPMDWTSWTVENEGREDLDWFSPSVRGQRCAPLPPIDERPLVPLGGNPCLVSGGGDGRMQYPAVRFLLAYWIGRRFGFLALPGAKPPPPAPAPSALRLPPARPAAPEGAAQPGRTTPRPSRSDASSGGAPVPPSASPPAPKGP